MMKGSIADVVCLFLYGSKESCNAYAQLMSFFNLFMRIGMPQSRRHMAASEKKQHLSKQRCLLLRVMFSRICMDSMWIFRMHSKGIFLYIGESAQIPYEFILMCANADSSL
ncbi:hypothetical protein [[Clostridium] innocuum]|uniref:hypothetical protein n=1 Tax=Clostridium innocuum TaxID=1522 RepID=UPI001FF5F2A3|nr:hypothetical protein [[Clostridium] innocuum]UOX50710.1 hypothetical protein K5I27_01705 [[Clostridium] innocuum]